MKVLNKYFFLTIFIGISTVVSAKIVPNSLFSNHAVLQRGVVVPVWGSGSDGEAVTVEFNGQKKETKTVDGKWFVKLNAMQYGGPYTLKITGENALEVEDIYVGEVWVCSGQSNMERQLGPRPPQPLIADWEKERDNANYPLIREYYVPITTSDEPLEDIGSKWEVCSPESVKEWSAVGYFFARDLYKALNVPIGMLFTAVGGTPVEYWTSRSGLENHPALKKVVEDYDKALMAFPKQLAKYKRDGSKGDAPKNPAEARHTYGHFNAMISPLLHYAIKGVIWYQGESNQHNAELYPTLLSNMIFDWRSNWGVGEFPFLYVQVAPFKNMKPEIREAQRITLNRTYNTAMIVTTDCGDANDVHPPNKQPVGYRLSLAARALAYKEKIEYSGPMYETMEIVGDKVILHFSHTGKGLTAKEGSLKGFVIAAEDKNFVEAEAKIVGTTVEVTGKNLQNPVAVRYGWANVPDVNLFNKDGLPASPFKTDLD